MLAGAVTGNPRMGGQLWFGEDDTRDAVEAADRTGRLRGILDAVRSHGLTAHPRIQPAVPMSTSQAFTVGIAVGEISSVIWFAQGRPHMLISSTLNSWAPITVYADKSTRYPARCGTEPCVVQLSRSQAGELATDVQHG